MSLFYLVESVEKNQQRKKSNIMYGCHIIAAVLSLIIWICHSSKWKPATSQVKHCWFVPWRLPSEKGKENHQVQSVRNAHSFILRTASVSLHCCNKVIIGINNCIMEMTAVFWKWRLLFFFCFISAFLRVFIWYDCYVIYMILCLYTLAHARVRSIW